MGTHYLVQQVLGASEVDFGLADYFSDGFREKFHVYAVAEGFYNVGDVVGVIEKDFGRIVLFEEFKEEFV